MLGKCSAAANSGISFRRFEKGITQRLASADLSVYMGTGALSQLSQDFTPSCISVSSEYAGIEITRTATTLGHANPLTCSLVAAALGLRIGVQPRAVRERLMAWRRRLRGRFGGCIGFGLVSLKT